MKRAKSHIILSLRAFRRAGLRVRAGQKGREIKRDKGADGLSDNFGLYLSVPWLQGAKPSPFLSTICIHRCWPSFRKALLANQNAEEFMSVFLSRAHLKNSCELIECCQNSFPKRSSVVQHWSNFNQHCAKMEVWGSRKRYFLKQSTKITKGWQTKWKTSK